MCYVIYVFDISWETGFWSEILMSVEALNIVSDRWNYSLLIQSYMYFTMLDIFNWWDLCYWWKNKDYQMIKITNQLTVY